MTTWFSPAGAFTIAFSLRRIENNIVMVTPYLEANGNSFELNIGKWNWKFEFGGGLNSFCFGPDGVDLPPGVNGNLKVTVKGTTDANNNESTDKDKAPAYLIGTADGTRLELGNI